jgi:hypothetical protein
VKPAPRSKPTGSLSLDLDNKWSYMKTHGDPGWQALPSYLPLAVPRILKFLRERNLTITFFVVGQDADRPADREALAAIAEAGHEIGNHSYFHEPWLHLYEPARIDEEIARAESAIAHATGRTPVGFRGPGFSLSENVLRTLARRGYRYDCSTFPTYLGPLARAYYFATAKLTPEERRTRDKLFGSWTEGRRPLHPYKWRLPERDLLEIPVTTLPGAKAPIHLSYIIYLSAYSPWLAERFFEFAAGVCRANGVGLSLLLHPLDFLGKEDAPELGFFPGMSLPAERKLATASAVLAAFAARFQPATMLEHAEALERTPNGRLPVRAPRFAP